MKATIIPTFNFSRDSNLLSWPLPRKFINQATVFLFSASSVCNEQTSKGCNRLLKAMMVSDIRAKTDSSALGPAVLRYTVLFSLLQLFRLFSDVPGLAGDEATSEIRENFEEIWIFDSYGLGASGTTAVSAKSPDNVGKWSVSSAFWSPGQQELCPAPGIHVLSRKNVFMQVFS